MIILNRKATPSNSENPLENFIKLYNYAYRGSISAQKKAIESGIVYTIMKNGKIYNVFPNGRKVEVSQEKINDQNSFEPIRIRP
jgi:hypothetical protein